MHARSVAGKTHRRATGCNTILVSKPACVHEGNEGETSNLTFDSLVPGPRASARAVLAATLHTLFLTMPCPDARVQLQRLQFALGIANEQESRGCAVGKCSSLGMV
jgi:hypothetical protein